MYDYFEYCMTGKFQRGLIFKLFELFEHYSSMNTTIKNFE